MTYQLAKYSANGNDFIIFHTFEKQDFSSLAQTLCHRQTGVGADGLIVIVPHATYAYEWLFYNNDGSEAGMCGNGSRACAHYAYTRGVAPSVHRFLTLAGVIDANVEEDVVEVKLTEHHTLKEPFEEEGYLWHFYDTGVPHLVTYVDDLNLYTNELAAKMRYKYNTNVNFAKIDGESIHVRTYERGVEDETLACGTGMCAAFLGAHQEAKVKDSASIYPQSKEEVTVSFQNDRLYFKGPVVNTFNTTVEK